MQSNIFDYDNSNSPSAVKPKKSFDILPPRNLSPPKFGEVVVQEFEEDVDKSESDMFVAKSKQVAAPIGVYEQRIKNLKGTSEERFMDSLREMAMILNDGLDQNIAFDRNISKLRKHNGDLNNAVGELIK